MLSRLRFVLFFAATASLWAAEPPDFVIQNDELPAPSAAGAVAPELATSPDGTVYLSWLEPLAPGAAPGGATHAFRFSKYDAARRAWGKASTIAQGSGWVVNAADTPQLAISTDGRLTAAWLLANHSTGHGHHGTSRGVVSSSTDDGATWTAPVPLTNESSVHERIALRPLADGRVLAGWLDGRARAHGGDTTGLYTRMLGAADASKPDQQVDARVCDCCQIALAAFPDGDALIVYRGRGDDEVRDIRSAKFRDGAWQPSKPVNNDGWKIAACPINGPALASTGPAVAVAWFTAADGHARVHASLSTDAGGQFVMPFRVDDGKPLGRVDVALLRDHSALVSWVESGPAEEAGIFLRRIAPSGTLNVPVRLASTKAPRSGGFPQIAVIRDNDVTPAQLLLANIAPAGDTAAGAAPGLMTRLITLPAASTLDEIDTCGCAPRNAEERGFPMRGEVVSVDAERSFLVVKHQEIPGVMRAMTMQFKVAESVAKAMQPGRQILGRIERREGKWWLFDVRMLVGPRNAVPPAAAGTSPAPPASPVTPPATAPAP